MYCLSTLLQPEAFLFGNEPQHLPYRLSDYFSSSLYYPFDSSEQSGQDAGWHVIDFKVSTHNVCASRHCVVITLN